MNQRLRESIPFGIIRLIIILLTLLCSNLAVADDSRTVASNTQSRRLQPLTNNNIHQAVQAWRNDREQTLEIYGHISNWDTSLVTDMSHLFNDYSEFDDDISAWNTSSVTTMLSMFRNAHSFSGKGTRGKVWQTGNVQDMRNMFNGAKSLTTGEGLGLSLWKVSSVTTMNSMFRDATSFVGDVSLFDVSNVRDFTSMFQEANSLTEVDVSNWNVRRADALDNMFYGTENLKQQICFGSELGYRVTTKEMFCCSQAELDAYCIKDHRRRAEILSDSQKCAYSKRTCGIRDERERRIVVTTLSVIMSVAFLGIIWKYIPTTYMYERSVLCVRLLTGKTPSTGVIGENEEVGAGHNDPTERSATESPNGTNNNATTISTAQQPAGTTVHRNDDLEAHC